MATSVLLQAGCCPAGSAAVAAVQREGGKAVRLACASDVSPLHDDGSPDVDGWAWRVADVVGLSRVALAAGCPVPLVDEVTTWVRAAAEVAAERWDAVVLPVDHTDVARLVDAPQVLLRVLDARTDALAGAVGDDRSAASVMATLLDARRGLLELDALAGTACTWGTREAHARHGCDGAAGLGLPAVAAPGAPAEPGCGVRAEPGALVWWLDLPDGAGPELQQEDDRLLVRAGGRRRAFRLTGALTRSQVRSAAVVGGRLEVRFEPDPDAWR